MTPICTLHPGKHYCPDMDQNGSCPHLKLPQEAYLTWLDEQIAEVKSAKHPDDDPQFSTMKATALAYLRMARNKAADLFAKQCDI